MAHLSLEMTAGSWWWAAASCCQSADSCPGGRNQPMLAQCCASVFDTGPALSQHWCWRPPAAPSTNTALYTAVDPCRQDHQKLNLVWDRNSPMIVPTAAFSQTAWERWGIPRLHDQLTLKWATAPSGLSCLAGSSIVRQCNLLAAQKSALNLRVQNIMYYPEKWSICIEKENISGWIIIWIYYKKKEKEE